MTSRIWLPVRDMIPAKIEVWFIRRNEAKASEKIRPNNLARSPNSI